VSVLVEALSVIVPRRVLDVSFPGGVDAYLAAAGEPSTEARYVCADEQLTCVSFFGPDKAGSWSERLVGRGLIVAEGREAAELAYVDQRYGPSLPCNWLEWRRHEEGYTLAWLSEREPGALAAPDGWTPERSRRLVRRDVRDEPGRMLRLAKEDGIETWLDFDTGEQIVGLPHRDVVPLSDDAGDGTTNPTAVESASPPPSPNARPRKRRRDASGAPANAAGRPSGNQLFKCCAR
jgi:hypothetical protein